MDIANLKSILDADPRPSFLLDHDDPPEHPAHLQAVYANKSLRSRKDVFSLLTANHTDSVRLRAWANTVKPVDPLRQELHFGPGDSLWIAYLVENRWKVVQNFYATPSTIPFDVITPPDDAVSRRQPSDRASPSEFPMRPQANVALSAFALPEQAITSVDGLDAHLDIILNHDWASTSLGPIDSWPTDLLQLVHLILLEPSPQCLFMGPDHVLLYNVAYASFAGHRHPAIMGQDIFSAWNEAVELNLSIFSLIDATGRPFIMNDFNISLNRNGFLEELYVKWTTIPLRRPLQGYLCTASEETARKVGERRKALLSKMSIAGRGIRDMSEFWNAVLDTLGTNGKDFPFAFIYSKVQGVDNIYNLEGVLDSQDPSSVLPATIDLATSNECFAPVLREAQQMFNPVPIRAADGTLPQSIVALSTTRGSMDRCLDGIVCPIRRAIDNQTLGLLVVGLNTRKTFTEDDQAFVQYLMRSLGDLATNTINAQETDRLTQQAASQHQTLVKALATTTTEANQISSRWQRLVKTMEILDVGFFEFDLDGKLIQANEAFFKISGYPKGDDAAMTWKSLIYPDDLHISEQNWSGALAGEHRNFEGRYKFHDGHAMEERDGLDGYWVSTAIVPITDHETGTIVSISGCVTNIMPQKRQQHDALARAEALQKLRTSEERFHRFAEHALCPIMIYDSNRKLQFCNQAYYDLMGFEKGDPRIWEIDWSELLLDEDLPGVMENWMQMIETRKPLQMTCRLKKNFIGPDGTVGPTYVVTNSYPEVNEEGDITGWVGVAFDISQVKWAETLQQKRLDEAIEAKRQHENFIDMTSHEIRNPLGAVVHCADSIFASLVDLEAFVKDPNLPISKKSRNQLLDIYESSFDAVNTIISCSTHQRRIVDDVLTWSKLNSNLLKISPSLVRPEALLQDIRNMFELDAAKVGVSLTVQRAIDGMDTISAEWIMLDCGRLMQILINLVTNAIKFTREEGTRNVTVTMGVTASKPSLDRLPLDFVPCSKPNVVQLGDEWGTGQTVFLYFMVEDTGCGLSLEEQSRIFARFSQGSPRTHTKYGGSGLGLWISRELAELQAGEIGFASQAGHGSKFGFFVRGRVAEGPVGAPVAGFEGARLPLRLKAGQRYSVLIVEDNVVNQAVLSKQLRKLGHEVHVANHGGEALRWLRGCKMWKGREDTPLVSSFAAGQEKREDRARADDERPDLSVVLMDVEMPVMDGLSCTKEIRRWQQEGLIEGHVPIIAVSANARTEQIGHALKSGMDDAISKPFRIVDLMPKIERLVQ
ncbi:Hybrid signal transduction histidine kinase K [Sphaceloma murrayae]|uniref:Hybrid signal transduction histidine kinase K n=1 Tax=Sphaceloma murrayae TaxID=2082308 RepID=A0A2K1QK94_9PEZI|nr:Hybrid signal transduction histidine kinase K [Sphaceloma murrayae]